MYVAMKARIAMMIIHLVTVLTIFQATKKNKVDTMVAIGIGTPKIISSSMGVPPLEYLAKKWVILL